MSKLEKLLKERGPITKIGVLGMGLCRHPLQPFFLQMPPVLIKSWLPAQFKKLKLQNRDAQLWAKSPLKGEEPGLEDLISKVVKAGNFSVLPISQGSPNW